MPFRFRAQSALDLRQREETDAKHALGAARQQVALAASAVAAAEARLADGLKQAREERARATSTTTSGWLRNWLAGQHRDVATLHRALGERRDAERQAAETLVDATRRVRALVHLRERLWQAHALEERRAEQRELDWHGSLRHLAAHPAEDSVPRPQEADRGQEARACQ
jgi:flagellar export protein FliJ